MIAVYIDPKLQKFISEIKYTFSFIFKTLGYELKFISKIDQVMNNDILFYYGLIQPSFKEAYYLAKNKVLFFIPVYAELLVPGKLNKDTIKRNSQEMKLLKKIPIISKERIQIPFQYYNKERIFYGIYNFDLIGNIFYSLIGYEEFSDPKRDEENRIVDEEYNFLKFKSIPYINHFLWLVENCIKDSIKAKESYFLLKKEFWPQAEKFGVIFSHSVNSLRKWNFKKISKSTFEDILQFYRVKYIIKNTISRWKYILTNIEEYWNFSKIEEIENLHHINSTYFYGTEKNSEKDVDYRLQDKDVNKEVIDSINQGNEIALLASDDSCKNDVLEKEKDKLHNVIKNEEIGIRHYLGKFDPQLTTEFHNKNGFAYDSSVTYINNIGFKYGIGFPYHLHRLTKSGKRSKFQYQSKYFELPISYSDNALFISKGKTLEFDQAKEYADEIIREIERINGFLNFDFTLSNMTEIPYNKELMNYVAEQIRPKNVFWATCAEMVDWWRKRESIEISESENGVLIYFPDKLDKFTFELVGEYMIVNIEGAKSEISGNKIIFSEIKSDTKVQVLLELISKTDGEEECETF